MCEAEHAILMGALPRKQRRAAGRTGGRRAERPAEEYTFGSQTFQVRGRNVMPIG